MGKKKAKTKAKKSAGEKYQASYAERALFLIVELGLVNARGGIAVTKLAKALGVTAKTIRQWRKADGEYYKNEFAKALKTAAESIECGDIKRSMIDRAKGYKRTRKTYEKNKKGRMVMTKREDEQMAGDVGAAKLCLANMGPEDERWKEKSEVEHKGDIIVNHVDFSNVKRGADSGS